MAKADLAAAVAAAVTETEVEMAESLPPDTKVEGTGVKPEATTEKKVETPPPAVVGNEVEPEVVVSDEDIATFKTRFGVDLSVLPDDVSRAAFMAEHTETNKTIGKLQRELAEVKAAPPPEPPKPAPVEPVFEAASLSDAQIAEALGIDLENSLDSERDIREVSFARKYLEQEERLAKLESATTDDRVGRVWTSALDDLEGRFGKLPVERSELLAFAAKEGIASPEAAYWTAVGPVRATVAQALESRLIELKTDAKKQATTLRPKTSAAVDENALKATNAKDAIAEAFEKARAALGVTLTDS